MNARPIDVDADACNIIVSREATIRDNAINTMLSLESDASPLWLRSLRFGAEIGTVGEIDSRWRLTVIDSIVEARRDDIGGSL